MQAGTFEAFKEMFVECPTSGCWLWTRASLKTGYGTFSIKGKTFLAHRKAYEFYIGPIPEGMDIDHKCGLKSCVNPEHLRLATRSQT